MRHDDAQELTAHGLDAAHHPRALALKPRLQALGVDWQKVLAALREAHDLAPAVLDALERIFGG